MIKPCKGVDLMKSESEKRRTALWYVAHVFSYSYFSPGLFISKLREAGGRRVYVVRKEIENAPKRMC